MILLLFIIIYGGCFLLAEFLSNLIGVPHVITAFAILIYAVALIFYMQKERKKRYLYGFKWKFKKKDFLFLLPLLVLPILNLVVLNNSYLIFTILTFVGVCIVEEVFFRNYLYFYLNERFSTMQSILISSAIFAFFHTANLLNGFDLLFVIAQIVSAFSVGFCFGAIAYKFKSLTPCLSLHFIINLTGIGTISVNRLLFALLISASSLIYLLYGLFILSSCKITKEPRRY